MNSKYTAVSKIDKFILLSSQKSVNEKKAERKIGILDGKVTIEFKDDFAMTAEKLGNL